MLLTDPAVQYWSCVVAILATLAVLILWNKVRGPVIVKGLSRFGLLLGGYVATTVAVLVSVNIAYGGLVVSVDDLFADINPPMGHYMHHHRQCGDGGAQALPTASAAAAAAAAADATTAAAVAAAEHYAAVNDTGDAGGAGDAGLGADGGGFSQWSPPCPQSSTPQSSTAAAGGVQAATAPSAAPPERK